MASLSEQILRINEIIGETNIISEVSKLDILKTKVGVEDEMAEWIYRTCGNLSVWITNKFLKELSNTLYEDEVLPPDVKYVLDVFNGLSSIKSRFKNQVTSIMDYIRVGLRGNIKEIKNLDFPQIYEKTLEWHDSLGVGSGDINYVEKNDIIIDFRNEDGFGFYWADLNTNNSDEECNRMGHCGRTSSNNNLYSLRQVSPASKGFTINTSHLTAAIDEYQHIIYQLKGKKNSKPKEEYHKYIIPLFYVKKDGEYLISSFGSEYDSENDFKLSDLGSNSIGELYKKRSELFSSPVNKMKLYELGIIEELPNFTFIFDFDPEDISILLDTKNIRGSFIQNIITGEDYHDIYIRDYVGDWMTYIPLIDKENMKDIISYLIKNNKGNNQFNEQLKLLDFNSENAVGEFFDLWDVEDNIKFLIIDSVEYIEKYKFRDHYYDEIKSALEEYGDVLQMNYEGIKIKVNLFELINDIDYLGELYEICGDNENKCVFTEFVSSEGPIRFNPRDAYVYVDVDDYNQFNEYLHDNITYRLVTYSKTKKNNN